MTFISHKNTQNKKTYEQKNKKLSIIALIAGTLISLCGLANASYKVPVLGWDLHPLQPVDIAGEVSFKEKRIDRGLFTHTDAFGVGGSAVFGSAYDNRIVGGVDFIDGKNDDLFTGYLGIAGDNLYVGLNLGTNAADGDLTGDTDFNLNVGYAYDPNFFDVIVSSELNYISGGAFDFSFNVTRELFSAFGVFVNGSVEVGKTWQYTEDYEWVQGAVSAVYGLPGGGQIFGEVAYVDNQVQTDGFETVFQAGVKYTF